MRYADYVVGDDLSNSEFSQLQLSQVEGNYSVNTSYQAINVVGSSIDSGSDGVPLAEPRPWAVGGGLEAYGDGGVVFGAAVHPEEPCPSVGVVPATIGGTVEDASQREAGGPQESVAGSGVQGGSSDKGQGSIRGLGVSYAGSTLSSQCQEPARSTPPAAQSRKNLTFYLHSSGAVLERIVKPGRRSHGKREYQPSRERKYPNHADPEAKRKRQSSGSQVARSSGEELRDETIEIPTSRVDPFSLGRAWSLGHVLWTTAGCVRCVRCGFHAVEMAKGLKSKCPKACPAGRKTALTRLLNGQHTNTGRHLGVPRPLPTPDEIREHHPFYKRLRVE